MYKGWTKVLGQTMKEISYVNPPLSLPVNFGNANKHVMTSIIIGILFHNILGSVNDDVAGSTPN